MQIYTNPNSPYQTSPLIGLEAKTNQSAEEIYSLYHINANNDDITRLNNIFILKSENNHIHSFLHPVIYKGMVFIDARAYYNRQGNLRNYGEYNILINRAKLVYAWYKNNELFNNQENFIIDAFSSWISYRLQHMTNCNLLTATNYRIICAIYYLGLMTQTEVMHDEDCIIYILKRIPRITNIPVQNLNDILAIDENSIIKLFKCNNKSNTQTLISQLAIAITELTENEITITPSVIYNSCCRGAFIASNALEIATTSLEYIPSFISMLHVVFMRGAQNKTGLGKVVLGIQRRYDINDFFKFIERINTLK